MAENEENRQKRLKSLIPIRERVQAILASLQMPACTFAGNAGIGDTTMDDFMAGKVATKPNLIEKIVAYLDLLESGDDVTYQAADRGTLLQLLADRDHEIQAKKASINRLLAEIDSLRSLSTIAQGPMTCSGLLREILEGAARDVLREVIRA